MKPVSLLPLKTWLHHHRRHVFAALGTLMLGSGVVAIGLSPTFPDAAQLPVQKIVEPAAAPIAPPDLMALAPAFDVHQSQLTHREDSVQTLLKRLGLDDREAQAFLARDATSRSLLTGAPGKLASVTRTAEGRLKNLSVRWAEAHSQRVSRLWLEQHDGGYTSRLEQPTPRRLLQFGSLILRSSFYPATDQADIPDAIASQVVEAFSGDVDFQRDLQRGARFNLVYEAFELDGEILFTGRLLGTDIQNGKETHQAKWLQQGGQPGEFASLDGESQRRAFLASPLAFSRVTSSYGPRTHPVFGVQKDHMGTDFGEPAGTPVRTVADGVVTFAGRQGGYGNYVVIRHPNAAATAYAHLERIAVRGGQRVQQGQNVGTVGSTGTATGPNLHFGYLVKGVRTNPSKFVGAPPSSTAVLASLPSFRQEAKAMREQLAMAASVALANAQEADRATVSL